MEHNPFGTRSFPFLSPLFHQARRKHVFGGGTGIDKKQLDSQKLSSIVKAERPVCKGNIVPSPPPRKNNNRAQPATAAGVCHAHGNTEAEVTDIPKTFSSKTNCQS